ncbi:MAG: D-alanine--D-alanine ligase family protein [Clostridiaceae bacterium]|nr:D-alanine--D-alanine ligase [Eubacteriales bacterium]
MMTDLGIFFGSRTAEHDVSVISGLQALENADKSKYNAFPVYISRAGEWFTGEPLKHIETYRDFDPNLKGLTRVFLPAVPNMNGLYTLESGGLFKRNAKVCNLDCALLALHGLHGEDGSIQGLFELANLPYTSCGLIGSAVGMDKIVMKEVFRSMGLNVLESVHCCRSEWQRDREAVLRRAQSLSYPLIVKPCNLGSSIGITKAKNETELIAAIDVAAGFDRRILIERALHRPTEINCACVGYGGEATVSLCEQPLSWELFMGSDDDMLDFNKKYLQKGGKGMESLSRRIPAPIGDELTEKVQAWTKQIFSLLECKGVVRIDYMLDAEGELYVNEINTIPGSLAFYLFEPMGLKFSQLVDKLVEYAYKALAQKNESTYAYNSDILKKSLRGAKHKK